MILGAPYTCAIDMWSLGCIVTELLTGLPLLPGEEEQDQVLPWHYDCLSLFLLFLFNFSTPMYTTPPPRWPCVWSCWASLHPSSSVGEEGATSSSHQRVSQGTSTAPVGYWYCTTSWTSMPESTGSGTEHFSYRPDCTLHCAFTFHCIVKVLYTALCRYCTLHYADTASSECPEKVLIKS